MIDPCQGSEDTAQAPPWRLSAPESLVLLHGSGASGSEAFKLGLIELVAIGALILETTAHRVLFMERHVAALRDGPRAGAARPRALEAIFDLYTQTPHQAVVDGLPALAVKQTTTEVTVHRRGVREGEATLLKRDLPLSRRGIAPEG